jgi:hypothetical protein
MTSTKILLLMCLFTFILCDEGVFAKKHKRAYFSYKPADGGRTQTIGEKLPIAVFILFGVLCIVLFELRFNTHARRNH